MWRYQHHQLWPCPETEPVLTCDHITLTFEVTVHSVMWVIVPSLKAVRT